ncbi:MAG: alanine racemase [Thermoleophilia bacterium]
MPRLTIDLAKIEHNTRRVAELLRPHQVRLAGVTKGCMGNERVAEAMLAGGAAGLCDSRARNIRNLRRHFADTRIGFLRSPVTRDEACFDADAYFVSSLEQALPLLRMARRPLRFCLMIETGDGREGVPPELATDEAARIAGVEDADLVGLATNAACARAGAHVGEALAVFNEVAAKIDWRLGRGRGKGLMSSVGGSGLLRLLTDPEEREGKPRGWSMSLFAPVTELRCGEAILLGRIPSGSSPDLYLDGAWRDAFLLEGPVLEVFEKNGVAQALVGFGVQDTGGARLIPCHPGITPASATSDYFAISCSSPELTAHPLRIGEPVRFIPTYYALVAAMTSPFVEKEFI